MCTAVCLKGAHRLFGRNLDLEYSYNECVTVTPRRFPLYFSDGTTVRSHAAIIGMAAVSQGYPLYFDAMSEHGLCMAGLNFPNYCRFSPPRGEAGEIAPYELIARVLATCETMEQAHRLLRCCRVVDRAFSDTLPVSPLHWLVSDGEHSLAVEPLRGGLRVTENAVGVLTNSPPLFMQMTNLCQYRGLSAEGGEGRLAGAPPPYSKGQGAFGLPGDLSSMSRFVRAVFTRQNARFSARVTENVGQLFHVMDSVAQVRGCNRTADGEEITRYTCVMDADTGVYYYTTYDNRRIVAVDSRREPLDRDRLILYPLMKEQDVFHQNG